MCIGIHGTNLKEVGVNEIVSCVWSYLTMLNGNAQGPINVIFYSDNQYMIGIYRLAVNTLKNLTTFTHKFLIKGRTQNEGDSRPFYDRKS